MLWLKAFHLIFVVCWFAGLFYLPRIFVYYAASEHPETRQQLAVMARRLYRFVTPFMLIAIALGLALMAQNPDYYLRYNKSFNRMGGEMRYLTADNRDFLLSLVTLLKKGS